ncbi:DUF3626 domain-containing protein [Micromonospora sp. LAH09]|uniref:DUF3626 domain-containing protein n=1 Tax=Micromonospora cabrerizensis TaxID=2911213 RepID=UPI001EE8311F|nr:DUF3626 domain-containing protein [Micromonospora cabrerizensis]MCG5472421.1 DUF3626 domain-containing protein [Micromonospora cabrerizensis]
MTVTSERGGLRVAALTPAQTAAVAYVRSLAVVERPAALATIARHLATATADDVHRPEHLLAAIGSGRLTVNFHPDRLCADGRTVADALAGDGAYRSQFVTGISNGGLTAYPGGDRDRWEHRMFDGAYQRPGVTSAQRPTYGGLNLLDHADGACPRFGSCHLRLRPPVLSRATFCLGDSHLSPTVVGTADAFEAVLAGLLAGVAATGECLGRAGTDLATLARTLLDPPTGPGTVGRALDDYVEAQVHGTLDLAYDVEALVVDPSFAGTPTGATLESIAQRHGFPLRWHPGFVLAVDRVDAEFRGPAIPVLAARVHREFARAGEPVDAALIGRAAASVVAEPHRWADRGPIADTLQHLKQLWHVLVRHGTAYGT